MRPHRDQIVVAERARTANICVLAIKIVLRPPATRRFAIPAAQVEYERTRFFDAGSDGIPFQDNYKIGAGLLIRFGER